MSNKTIAIVDYDWADLDIEETIVKKHGLRLISGHAGSEDEVIELAKKADGIVVQYAPVTEKVLDKLPECRVISRYGIGVDSIDVDAAAKRNIPVCNVPDYCFDEVTDHAAALIMGLIRQVFKAANLVKQGKWSLDELMPIPTSSQCTIGVVGFGGLGRILARKMKALGYNCIASDPFQNNKVFQESGVENVSLEELLKRADVVSMHAPYNKGTHYIIGKREFGLMKSTAYLVNTSRGKLVDSNALFNAVKNGQIAGAGLDVLEQEPPAIDDPLLSLDNIYITPHIAFYSEDSIKRLRAATIESVVDVLEGRVPRSVVNGVSLNS